MGRHPNWSGPASLARLLLTYTGLELVTLQFRLYQRISWCSRRDHMGPMPGDLYLAKMLNLALRLTGRLPLAIPTSPAWSTASPATTGAETP